jgi:hypothetical protein
MFDSIREAAMDRFVNQNNIERYRKLANETTNPTERLQVMKLLADEEAKFKLEVRAAMVRRGVAIVRPFERHREEQRDA